jgi:hypothetical protein
MNGAAAVVESSSIKPNSSSMMIIGASHHFLFSFKNDHSSLKIDISFSDWASLEKSSSFIIGGRERNGLKSLIGKVSTVSNTDVYPWFVDGFASTNQLWVS